MAGILSGSYFRELLLGCIGLKNNTDQHLKCLSVLALYCYLMYSEIFKSDDNMPWSEYSALLLLGFAMSFSPGPNTALSTAIAANRGLKAALPFVLSVPLGWGVLLLVCALGVGSLIMAVPALAWAVKAFGCVYLLWLAYQLFDADTLAQADASRLNISWREGVALQFVNIKAWMFALSAVAGWLVGTADFGLRLALLMPTLMAFALFSNLTYALVGAVLRGWLAKGSRLLWFNRMMASVLIVTAFWMLTV
jgi:threonine/homoserine/homoserine lactone efflux protein